LVCTAKCELIYLMEFSSISPFFPSIIRGLYTTVLLTVISSVFGSAIGLFLFIVLIRKAADFPFLLATAFVEVVRAVPPLVWLIWAYFVLPIAVGVRLDGFLCAAIVFSIIYGAFAADIFRGARASVPTGIIESALAIGMSDRQLKRHVLGTEVLRRSFAALNAQTIGMLKMTSLASVIAVPELTYAFQLIVTQRPLPLEVYSAMAVAYCALIFPLVFFLRRLEASSLLVQEPKSYA
jgi:polar amino acid transport system permease protein